MSAKQKTRAIPKCFLIIHKFYFVFYVFLHIDFNHFNNFKNSKFPKIMNESQKMILLVYNDENLIRNS